MKGGYAVQDLAVNLGIDVLFKGTNFIRLLGGLWTALWISLVSVAISIPLGIGMGVLMTKKNRILKAVLRVYLEFIRIMPQLVLLFIMFFGTTRAFGWDLSGEAASIIVFVLWGTAEMGDLVHLSQYRSISMKAVRLSDLQIHRLIFMLSYRRR